MTYWNRKKQLSNTLHSIRQYGHDVEIIVVDDASTDGEDIHCFEDANTHVITLKDKTWINPCIGFNSGFKYATGDIIIIQNAECLHVGDIVSHALSHVSEGIYLSYSALAINGQTTKRINDGENVVTVITPFMHNKMTDTWDGNGWYNHPVYRNEAYHFCCAIMRSDLYDLGGFDERYADGLGFDDNELLTRIIKKRMTIRMIEKPFVVHQDHPKFQPGDVSSLMAINALKLEKTKKRKEYDVKSFNSIYK